MTLGPASQHRTQRSGASRHISSCPSRSRHISAQEAESHGCPVRGGGGGRGAGTAGPGGVRRRACAGPDARTHLSSPPHLLASARLLVRARLRGGAGAGCRSGRTVRSGSPSPPPLLPGAWPAGGRGGAYAAGKDTREGRGSQRERVRHGGGGRERRCEPVGQLRGHTQPLRVRVRLGFRARRAPRPPPRKPYAPSPGEVHEEALEDPWHEPTASPSSSHAPPGTARKGSQQAVAQSDPLGVHVLPLGVGLSLFGLGLGFLGLRMRRG